MPTNYLYDNGLPFSQTLADNLKDQLANRIDKKKPSLILIDGGQGEGKTTLLTEIIDYVNEVRGLGKCDLSIKHHPQIALGGNEFTKQFNVCKKEGLPIIGYDEAGDFTKRGAVSSFNARLIRRFETFRSSNIMVVLCLPNMGILDSHLFDLQIVRGLIHLKDRTTKYGNFFAYNGMEVGWIRYWMDKLPKPLRYQAYNRCAWSFRGHFKDLPPARSEALGKLSDFGKDREDMLAEIKYLGLLSYREIAQRLSRSIVWVRAVVKDLKIQPDRIIKKVMYFKKDVLDVLLEYRDSKETSYYKKGGDKNNS